MQMVAPGLSTGALFLLVGYLYQRTGTYNLREWGGLRKVVPMFSGVMGVAMFANLGLPGLAGCRRCSLSSAAPGLAAVLHVRGRSAGDIERWRCCKYRGSSTVRLVHAGIAAMAGKRRLTCAWPAAEFLAAGPLLVLLLILGVYPAPIMDLANQTATALVKCVYESTVVEPRTGMAAGLAILGSWFSVVRSLVLLGMLLCICMTFQRRCPESSALIWINMLVPAIIMMFLKPEQKYQIRLVGTAFAFISLALSLLEVFFSYDYNSPQKLQFVEELPWLPRRSASASILATNGIGMPMLI